MAGRPVIEIREWGRPARRRLLDGPIVFGRDGSHEVLADSGGSRQHLRLVPTPTSLSVVDLGSRNGTTVNGVPLTGRHELVTGDVVRLGRSEILVLHTPTAEFEEHELSATVLGPSGPLPRPPGARAALPRWVNAANRVLGIDPTGERNPFPAFTELPSRIPLPVWQAARFASIAVFLALVVTLFVRPAAGLFWFFKVVVPILPGLFLIAPGLWRNTCPLAATNQLPRLFGFTRAATPPVWMQRRGYLIAVALFFGIAGSRVAGLDRSGIATGAVLSAVLVAAFTGGVAFKGKSGWCSSICPLFPLQRVYGQTPFVTIANNHCRPCVGCAKNCFDFKPRAAYQADMADPDPGWSAPRKLFAAALPGFVLGFMVLAGYTGLPVLQRYLVLAVFLLAAIGVYFAVEALTGVSAAMLSAVYAALALNVFYWFAGPVLLASFATVTGVGVAWLHWPISVFVLVASVLFLARTRVSELQYALTTGARTEPVLLPFPRPRADAEKPAATGPSVILDGTTVAAETGASLLELAEQASLPLEAGCRMGVCGADPVAVLEGGDQLCEPTGDERNTLRRLGFAANTRMACCARVNGGGIKVALTPEPGHGNGDRPAHFDRSLVSLVVIGNGIAGVTAADFLRRGHPDCEIHLVGRESHDFYNRMGISRLIPGRSAMQGLHLLPEQWYEEHRIHPWLNTLATQLDPRAQRVHLGTGDVLPYDRLILATGAAAALPEIEGLHRPGSFVLREAGDALRIRAYAQQRSCTRAVVAGGGLLGLEAAYALHQLGLRVTVLERGERMLGKQLDRRASAIVHDHFARAGIEVRHRAETAALTGGSGPMGRSGGQPDASPVTAAILKDGTVAPCEIFLASIGIRPNVDLARRAGIPVRRGILVDDRMRTAAPNVYAAGDVAEHRERVLGLWPIAAEQAQAAAVNALGGDQVLSAETPATILKGVGLELFSIGQVEPGQRDEVIVVDRAPQRSYRRLVISANRLVGAIVLGHHPTDVAAAQQAVRARREIDPYSRNALQQGDWSSLQ
ncbi:FAD-dependent oxidoreductase [Nocardia seriolae]|uniref:Ferredoxin--NAD(+) reductase n=1 Tax=Nocardia seriolae TaxID=37332 RepID=A0A0B8N6H1_9NOCA|nr:FAD-dependent oxidoreductase [Nocardia seriolae]APB00904.1 Ferredoxin--NAD(+) reductase [Nocardia seriolae]MTJ65448.1 FHA domain-containing protein [Nocardia seriolae]MTJ70873.1 FHA domain-containing protein [Nocardia seriolae]MTJ90334.1 FHA domain-containing protein [Nocardia seriolae]MTK34295.1 FHA domain-containing protein [Nocardia seriolae]